MNKSIDIDRLKKDVLTFTETLKIPGMYCRYKFSPTTDATIFSSLFALFIKDLFKETDNFSEKERNEWINYIQSFQNPEYGYFEPEEYYHKDKERNSYQLTAFCLSALSILKAEPLYELKFVDINWPDKESVNKYLYERGCHFGKGGSGNKAMFLAIFLTYQYEKTGENRYKELINQWFDFHDKHQNLKTGFWGNKKHLYYYKGFQNAFHQFIVYDYWKKNITHNEKILTKLFYLRNNEGSFSQYYGGNGCHDYDAIHFILSQSRKNNIKRYHKLLINTLSKLWFRKNKDGGFPQYKYIPSNFFNIINYLPFVFTQPNLYIIKIKFISLLKFYFNRNKKTYDVWVKNGCDKTESNLWDTWFRSLTICELFDYLNSGEIINYNNHKLIGLGQKTTEY